MRTLRGAVLVVAAAVGASVLAVTVPGAGAATTRDQRYVVLYAQGASLPAARAAVRAAGGRILKENRAVGAAVVVTRRSTFRLDARRSRALAGVARDRYIGYTPPTTGRASATPSPSSQPQGTGSYTTRTARARTVTGRDVEKGGPDTTVVKAAAPDTSTATTREPLAARQWDMRMLRTAEAHQRQRGDRRVLVGVVDTGIEGSHPDIAANFDRARSRNFVRDIPTDPVGTELDGPCEAVFTCIDPVDRDDNGHGTHVASTIASPLNGRGIAGVAPGVRLVNIRAGQDAGFFFLMPTLDAITYAGDAGIDVLNMSFYTDPWLYNCTANPADSAEEQEEQRTIITATRRATAYAYDRGVTLLAAAGNNHQDLGRPGPDETSPDYPQSRDDRTFTRTRRIDNATCLSMPSEAPHVLDVVAVGPSGRKSFFSDYGVEQAVVAAPGGDSIDATLPAPLNRVLAAYPAHVLREEGLLEANGNPVDTPLGQQVVREGNAYWRYLQGTSMAAPHAAGVAALIVSEYGEPDRRGGLTLDPATTEAVLTASAEERPCPEPRTVTYERPGYEAVCEGDAKFNGFFGHGVVNALNAVAAAQ